MSRRLFFVLLTLAFLLVACSPASTPQPAPLVTEVATSAPITLSDGLGRTVTLNGPAQRIVSLAPSNTEILFAVGAGTQVAGRDEASDYPDEALSLPTVGGWSGFSTESIVALQPDLVLAGGINTPELVASLESLGLRVYFLPNPATIEEMYANLETMGLLTGHEVETAALVKALKVRVAAVDEKIAAVTERPSVYYELDATDPTKPYTAGPGSFVDLLIRRAGGANVGAQLQGQWVQISLEELLILDPDMILLGDALYGETPEKVAARPGWEVLSAVQDGRIYPFDDTLVSRPGPRLVDALEAMARFLHPGLFE